MTANNRYQSVEHKRDSKDSMEVIKSMIKCYY